MITTYCGLTRSGKSTMGVKIYRENPGAYDIFVTSFIGKGCGINCKNGDFERGLQLTTKNYRSLIENSRASGIIIDEPEELLSFDLIEFLKTIDKDVILLVNKYHDSHYENEYISKLLSISDKVVDLDIQCNKCGSVATKYIGGHTMYLCDECFEDEVFIENIVDISSIEFELHNYCNRRCPWCINSKIDRSINIKYMDDYTFEKMVSEVLSISENINIGISRYSEPMYDHKNLLNKSEYIKKNIPKSFLWISTNGDYLNKDTISSLKYIDQVRVMDYDNIGVLKVLDKIELLGLDISSFEKDKGREVVNTVDPINGTSLIFEVNTQRNRKKAWALRTLGNTLVDPNGIYTDECGNTHSNHKGLAINNKYCTMIGRSIMIDYNGDIFPCSDVCTDVESHNSELLIGNIINGIDSVKFNNYIVDKTSCLNCSFNAEMHTKLRNLLRKP